MTFTSPKKPLQKEQQQHSIKSTTTGAKERDIIKFLSTIPDLAWSSHMEVQADFRSDVVTRPDLASLAAIVCTTLGDDIWREDTTTIEFEQIIADLCGVEAAIFSPSCTSANQLALRCHLTDQSCSIFCDPNLHIVKHEDDWTALWNCKLKLQTLKASNGRYLRLKDLWREALHMAVDTRVIVLENTIGGSIVPLSDIQEISTFARNEGIKIHMDGARLWHAVTQIGGPSLKDYCRLCDTVALDFSKIIGAPGGTMLLGNATTIDRARRLRKAMGTFGQLGVHIAAAKGAFMEQFGLDFPYGNEVIRNVHRMAKDVEYLWLSKGGLLARPTETNMVWLDLVDIGISRQAFDAKAEENGLRTDGPRLVIHHQITLAGLEKLERFFDKLLCGLGRCLCGSVDAIWAEKTLMQ